MKRILSAETANKIGEEVVVKGWVNARRNMGKIAFVDLRDASGLLQVVLVPAEFLGVSNGLGYSINDARDTLEYDRLLAIVFAIGCLGLMLDSVVHFAEKRIYLKFMTKPG